MEPQPRSSPPLTTRYDARQRGQWNTRDAPSSRTLAPSGTRAMHVEHRIFGSASVVVSIV